MPKKDYDLIVAEKPSQAKAIAVALGGRRINVVQKKPIPVYAIRTPSGRIAYVTSAAGHIFDTEFEERVRKMSRVKSNPKDLLVKAKVIKITRPGSEGIIRTIKKLAKNASRLIIATDYDREGENIGRQIVKIAKSVNPKIVVKRARFSSMNADELREAFKEENLKTLNMNLVNASEARQESDLRVGASLTRLLSASVQRRLGRYDVVLSLGPVQTPTLGFVVERYLEHLKSLKEAKEEYVIVAVTDIGELTLQGKKRENKEEAERYAKTLPKTLKLVEVKRKKKIKLQPLPLNTPRLAELSARFLGLSAKKTLDTAEKLYLEGYISYPRTETDKRNEDSLKDARPRAFEAYRLLKPSRKPGNPRSGKRDDKAHPPIHPVKVVHPAKIPNAHKRKVYELILRHFLANFGPPAKIEEVTLEYTDGKHKFVTSRTNVKSPGRLEVYPYVKVEDAKIEEPPKEVKVKRYTIRKLPPKIKPPITEAELVKLMDKHGVGTDATFADHIAKIIERGYVKRQGKYLIPTETGLELYKILMELDPEMVKPDIRAYMEERFKLVERGELSKEEAVKENVSRFLDTYSKMEKNIHQASAKLASLVVKQVTNKKSKSKRRRGRRKRK